MSLTAQAEVEFDFQVAKINGKRLNASLFNQLFQSEPFNKNYELQYELKGRVYKNKNFVVFATSQGPKKFDITYYMHNERENNLGESIYSCLHEDLSVCMELNEVHLQIRNYYGDILRDESENPSYISDCIENLLNGKRDYYRRKEDYEILLSILKGEFKLKLERAYEKGLQKKRNLNKLINTFCSLPQIFL